MTNVRVLQGDVLESSVQTLVNTVNCVGIMGKGIALQFKKRFPAMFKDYAQRCESGLVRLGEPYLWNPTFPPWVLNFPTKDHWRSVARLSDIVSGIEHIAKNYRDWGIESLAVPPLGCGEGQLEWSIVGPTLYRELSRLNIAVELYAPFGARPEELDKGFLQSQIVIRQDNNVQRLVSSEVALASILRLVEAERYRWAVGRVSFQKMAYFATEAGIPTGLEYRRGSFGPFAEDLKKIQTRLLNNSVIREERKGQMFEIHTGPSYRDAVRCFQDDLTEWRPRIERVADLFLRSNTKQSEVLASAHYAAKALEHRPEPATERDVVDEVLRWKMRRRPPLKEQDVAEAIRVLNLLGWASVAPSHGLRRELDFAELVG